jgi:hypothetical protein
VIGFSGEVKEPGSYITAEAMGTPVVVTRDNDGQLECLCQRLRASRCKSSARLRQQTAVHLQISRLDLFSLDGEFLWSPTRLPVLIPLTKIAA